MDGVGVFSESDDAEQPLESRQPYVGGGPDIPLSREIVDRLGILAQTIVYGTDAGTVSLNHRAEDPRLHATRERVHAAFEVARNQVGENRRALELTRRSLLPDYPFVPLLDKAPADLFDSRDEPDRAAFVKWITSESEFATPSDTFGASSYELLRYSTGIYGRTGRGYVHSKVEWGFRTKGLTSTNAFAEEVTRAVARQSLAERTAFNPTGYINCANGTLEIATGTLLPHSPMRKFTWRIPVNFDSAATCPTFDQFLEEVLPDIKSRDRIQRLFGYILGQSNDLQLAFMFLGEGNNGKSTLLGVLKDLLGMENISTQTLQSLSENRFATADLYGKLANICADIPAKPVRYSGIFKMATGGDPMKGERKFHEAFSFVSRAVLVFSCNELPEVDDQSYAFWRRWILIAFPLDLTGREDRKLPERLRGEVPGILNWALEGLHRIKESGFLAGSGADELREKWKQRSDSIYWFVSTLLEKEPDGWLETQDAYGAYVCFCEEKSTAVRSLDAFGKALPKHLPGIRKERGSVVQGRRWGWKGLRLKEELAGHLGQDGLVRITESGVSKVSTHSSTEVPDTIPAKLGSWMERPVRAATEAPVPSPAVPGLPSPGPGPCETELDRAIRDDGPTIVYPDGTITDRTTGRTLHSPAGQAFVVHGSEFRNLGPGESVLYSDGAIVRRTTGEVLGTLRVARMPALCEAGDS